MLFFTKSISNEMQNVKRDVGSEMRQVWWEAHAYFKIVTTDGASIVIFPDHQTAFKIL